MTRGTSTPQRSGPPPEESALITAFLAGDADAFERLGSWASRSARPFQRLLGNDWDDALQEVRMELLKALEAGRFTGAGSLQAFVSRVARHRCIDRLRRRGRTQWVDLEAVTPWLQDRSILTRFGQQLSDRSLLRQLADLPKDCQRLWRWIADGHSYLEMSREWGIAEGTLRVRVRRCRQRALRLRDQLAIAQVTLPEAPATGSSGGAPEGAEST